MKQRRAFTLVEVVTVLAIMFILLALLFPILSEARLRGAVTVSKNNLRQLAAAWHMYLNEHDQVEPGMMGEFVRLPAQAGILASPTDQTPNGANFMENWRLGTKVSYRYMLNHARYREALLEADPNHGILIDGTIGRVGRSTQGRILRARRDGSVELARRWAICRGEPGGGVKGGMGPWPEMTDVWPCPPGVPLCEPGSYPCHRPDLAP